MRYEIRFRFDCEGEPPKVMICDEEWTEVIKVFDYPTLREPRERTLRGQPWSWEEDDWDAPPLAKLVLDLLNGAETKP